MKTSQFLFLAAVLAVQARAEEEKVIEGEVLQEFNDGEQTLIGLKDEEQEAGNTKHGKTAELLTDEEVDMAATRSVIKMPADMARMAFEDPDGLTVAGFFAVNEEGQVKNRDDGSPYQVEAVGGNKLMTSWQLIQILTVAMIVLYAVPFVYLLITRTRDRKSVV